LGWEGRERRQDLGRRGLVRVTVCGFESLGIAHCSRENPLEREYGKVCGKRKEKKEKERRRKKEPVLQ